MRLIIFSVFCLNAVQVLSQDSTFKNPLFYNEVSTDLLLGVSWQSDGTNRTNSLMYYEVGVAKSRHIHTLHGPASASAYIAQEFYFEKGQNIYGTKVGVWTHYLLDVGLALVYYTNFRQGNLKLRPELGVGIGRLRIAGGYNAPTINNRRFEALRRNNGQISIQYQPALKKRRVEKLRLLSLKTKHT